MEPLFTDTPISGHLRITDEDRCTDCYPDNGQSACTKRSYTNAPPIMASGRGTCGRITDRRRRRGRGASSLGNREPEAGESGAEQRRRVLTGNRGRGEAKSGVQYAYKEAIAIQLLSQTKSCSSLASPDARLVLVLFLAFLLSV